jgi:hypothetical protein
VIIFRTVALADSSVVPRLLIHPLFPGLGKISIRHDKTPLSQMSPIISNVWMTA